MTKSQKVYKKPKIKSSRVKSISLYASRNLLANPANHELLLAGVQS
jgi:hypothetical protein